MRKQNGHLIGGRESLKIWLRGQDLNLRPLGYERVQANRPRRAISPNTNDFSMLRSLGFGSLGVGRDGFSDRTRTVGQRERRVRAGDSDNSRTGEGQRRNTGDDVEDGCATRYIYLVAPHLYGAQQSPRNDELMSGGASSGLSVSLGIYT